MNNCDIAGIGRTEIYFISAVGLSSAVVSGWDSRRLLYRARARAGSGPLFSADIVKSAIAISPEAPEIRRRMTMSTVRGGKAIWSELYVQRYAPLVLQLEQKIVVHSALRKAGEQLSMDENSPLSNAALKSVQLKLCPDGTVLYIAGFDLRPPNAISVARTLTPVDVIIAAMTDLVDVVAENVAHELQALLTNHGFLSTIDRALTKYQSGEKFLVNENLSFAAGLGNAVHKLIFIEGFYTAESDEQPKVIAMHDVPQLPELAGIANQASWYATYSGHYLSVFGAKNIGYRADEIYITDRRTTVVVSEGFWPAPDKDDRPFDTRVYYKWDLLQATEYMVARLAYQQELLSYFQEESDIWNVANRNSLDYFADVADARATLRQVEDSLNLDLLVSQGFTRRLMLTIRQEVGLDANIDALKLHIKGAWEELEVRGALTAAVDAWVAAQDNIQLQRSLRIWAVIAAILAVISIASSITLAITHG